MKEKTKILRELEEIIKNSKHSSVKSSYTANLFSKGKEKIANKFGEESFETVSAFLSQGKKEIIAESADVLYHLLVLLEFSNLSIDDVCEELKSRMKKKNNDKY